MGDFMPPFVVAMCPVRDGTLVSDINWPMFLVKPDQVEEFKARWDGVPEGLEYVAVEGVMDLRGPFPRFNGKNGPLR